MMTAVCVVSYLAAAVAANAAVTWFGQSALPFTAFFLIPFDLVARDVLHDRWAGSWLWPRMAALVLGGSAVSWASATGSSAVCLASAVSFAAAGMADAITYQACGSRSRFARMIGSNAVSSIVDSVVFPLCAFGATDAWLSCLQAAAKFFGGWLWAIVFVVRPQR